LSKINKKSLLVRQSLNKGDLARSHVSARSPAPPLPARRPAALIEFFRCYKDKVYRLALTILRDVQEAEDITQEVFLRLLRQIHSYRGEAAFDTWLTAITVNACRDRLRRQKLRRALPFEWLRGRARRQDTDEAVEQRQWKRSLWEQVDLLRISTAWPSFFLL
jgi:DNA-directed RNA polymerase specialized sigma24 family protein